MEINYIIIKLLHATPAPDLRILACFAAASPFISCVDKWLHICDPFYGLFRFIYFLPPNSFFSAFWLDWMEGVNQVIVVKPFETLLWLSPI